MLLLKLVTTNFKKLGSVTIDFTRGMNVIAGPNAKGKSTTLQGVEAALFGVTVVPGKKEHIPTWGQTKFGLELSFWLPCGTYQLTRNGTTAKLLRKHEDGADEIVANGNTPVTEAVEALLGLKAKDWNTFVQSRQGASAGILEYGAAALNRKVEEFAGVDLIDKVQAEAQRQATLNTSHADSASVSEEVLKEAQNADTAAVQGVQAATAQVETAEKDLAAHGEFTAEKPASTEEMRQQQRDVDSLSNSITIAEVQVANATQRVTDAAARLEGKSLQDEAALRTEMHEAKTAGGELAAAEKVLQDEASHRKAVQQDTDESDLLLNTRQVEFVADWNEFDEDESQIVIDKMKVDIQAAEVELAARQEEVGKAKGSYDNLLMLSDGAVCPTCNRAKEEHDPVKLAAEAEEARVYWEGRKASVAEYQSSLNNMKADLKGRVETLASYNAAAAKLDEASAGHKANTTALAALRKAEVIQKELDAASAALTASREAYADLQAKLKGLTAANEQFNKDSQALSNAEDHLLAAQQDLDKLNADLEALPEPPTADEINAAVKAEAAYQDALTTFNTRKQALTFAVTEAKSELRFQEQLQATAKDKLQQLIVSAAKSVEHATLAKKYSRLVQFLRDRRQQYLKEVWDTIMGVASRLVMTASQGTITKVSNDEGDFFYEENSILAPTASASGAQKAMIGVALRVGLARALYGKDSLLIFDEPTAECSEHNAASLAAMIASSAKQVLLITHRDTDQSLAQNIINVGE